MAVLWHENFKLFKDRKSVILGVWAAPAASEALSKDGGLRPPLVGRASGAIGASQTPKMTDFRPLTNFGKFIAIQSASIPRLFVHARKVLCYAVVLPGREIGLPGRILAGLLPGKHRNRPSGRPGSPISGPDALLRNIE